eukprot:gene5071-5890_t
MKTALVELISKISSGCMSEPEIARVADEAAQAYADPEAFLAANPDINYDDTFPIPLGEWIVVGSLPDTVLFQADTYQDLFAQIVASFGPGVAFNLKPKQLAKTEALTALNRIQIQMSALNPENGGYVLMNFSQLLDDEIQAVLVYGNDVPRVLELCAETGIKGEPSLEALRVAVHPSLRSDTMGSTFNGLIGLIILALDIWAIINVFKSGASTGAKVLWILLILLLPVLGLIIWAIAGPRVINGVAGVDRAPFAPLRSPSTPACLGEGGAPLYSFAT